MAHDDALVGEFANPGPAWRGKPFWSWNGRLEEEELLRQVHVMKQMGLGGYFMHSRTGLVTEYLGDEWFALTNACADEGAREGMEAWLYDEDRWPSGTAGGLVTANPAHRARFLSAYETPAAEFAWDDGMLAAFAAKLDGVDVTDCVRLAPGQAPAETAGRTVLSFRVEVIPESSFYNGNTDVDRLSRPATEEFLRLTHEQYRARCGERLGSSILGIFTDEPHRQHLMTGFGSSHPNVARMIPWTERLPEEFRARFGYDLIDRLPEVFYRPDGRPLSQVKWHYVELLQELFLENFAQPIYDWCERNKMMLTGHVLHEDSLTCQVAMHGSLMRFYELMHVPGVDVLTEGNRAYWIAKQLQSAARQLGQKWLLSELYGCTGWQMSFESHKAVGDWQALFGINLRCHHLSWYTMAGEAKRDYPASILHQSAWWRDYHHVETYFARLGLLLSQGAPCCDVLVLSPVESLWAQIRVGWASGLSALDPRIQELERAYAELFHALAGAQIDFDYADEEMLGRLGAVERDEGGQPVLRVGQARYRSVVVGMMDTIRSSSVALLEEFRAAGGQVLFSPEAPAHVDAVPSEAAQQLAARSTVLPWTQEALVDALEPILARSIEILDPATGRRLTGVFCQIRQAGGRTIVVALNTDPEHAAPDALVRLEATGTLTEWNCLTGERFRVPSEALGGHIEFRTNFPASGERVWVIEPGGAGELPLLPAHTEVRRETLAGPFDYTLDEPNLCVLDWARWRLDGGEWQPAAEILKVDAAVRRTLGLPLRGGEMVQPWYRLKHLPAAAVKGALTLGFAFEVETLPEGATTLCLEAPESFSVTLNGVTLTHGPDDGWWVDVAFRRLTVPEGALRVGANELLLTCAFHEGIDLEAAYLLGCFGVRLDGTRKTLTAPPERLEARCLTTQGLPFYTGGVTYRVAVPSAPAAGERYLLETPGFEGACVKVRGAGRERIIPWQPYMADVTDLLGPEGALEVEVVLTRRNTFGPLHQVPLRASGYGPGNFLTEGAGWSDAYMLYPSGLLEPPVLRVVRE